ncbi:hypothetical protein HDU84_003990 [Entophlyctis sp. JEL0112]|nr:hypothetical protein HDU84_003990 [Entophlyctis sp. JEL0112]
MQESGMHHVWINDSGDVERKLFEPNVLVWSFEDFLVHKSENRKSHKAGVTIPIPAKHEYNNTMYLSKPTKLVSFMDGFDPKDDLKLIVNSLAKSEYPPDFMILPTALADVTSGLPSSIRTYTINRISRIFPTLNEFVGQIAKHTSHTSVQLRSTFSKRQSAISVIGLPACKNMHDGGLSYLSELQRAPTVQFFGQVNTDTCIGHGSMKLLEPQHYPRIAKDSRLVVLFLDLLEGSGYVLPDVFFHALTWDTIPVIVSRFDHRDSFPCPKEASRNCVIWIDPTTTAPTEMLKILENVANDRLVWEKMMEWRKDLLAAAGFLYAKEGTNLTKETAVGLRFLSQWQQSAQSVVCALCKLARET